MYKSKRQKNKSFDWYGLSQRFSIRKYHFGAASVLLGTALILGAAQSTANAEEATADNKTEAVTSTPKDGEGATSPTNVTLPATEATTGAPVLDKKELSEEEIAKLAAEASKKDDKTSETATTEKLEVADKEKATQAANSTDKKSEKAVDDKADKKDEKKAENPIAATKTILEQLTSEAEVLNTTAANYAEKKVEDKSSKEVIAAAVAAAKVEIAASKKVLNEKDVTAEQLNLQLQRISTAIEAVYTEMKRAGHIGKVEAVLAGETSSVVNVVAPTTKTAVKNLSQLTEEEVRAIEKEVRSSNPGLTDEDTVTVSKEGKGGTAGGVTVTLGAGRLTQNGTNTITFGNTDVVVGTAGTKNIEQLKNAINWFDFANASITYPDGTKVSAVKYLNAPESRTVPSPNGDTINGNFTMYREVLYSPDKTLIGKRTIDQEVIDKGFAKYAFNRTYNKVNRENNALYEVLQEGMKFNVKTKVEGYELTATVAKLAPKQVKNNVIPQDKNYSRNLNPDGSYDPAYVILKPQDERYSTLGKSGIHTTYRDESGVERKMLTAFASADDGGNVGVTFDLAATFNGRPVAVNAVAADSEDLNAHEFTQFETNGTPWKEFMTVQPANAKGGIVPNTDPLLLNKLALPDGSTVGGFGIGIKRANNERFSLGYDTNEWKNTAANNEEPGFGSTLFGPFISPQDGGTLPIGLTQNVSRLSVYVNAAGNQTATIGFVVYDGGDAPESYGDAEHIIGTFNKEKDGKQVTATQPYLGDQPADPDFRNTTSEPSGAWVLDDLVHTEKYEEIGLKTGDKISNALGDTGTYDVVDGVSVIRKSSTETIAIKQGEVVSINRPKKAENSTELVDVPVRGIFNSASKSVGIGALPDEGEHQLIDSTTGIKEYTLRQATDNEYVLEGIKVNRGVNNDDAYVRAWVDFNNNGKFDQFESSEVIHVTQDGTVNISFKNTPQLLDTSVDSIGVRVRIALKEKEILVPTGIASSGEVEDFLTHVVHFPRGTRHRSEGYQGQKQEVNLPTTAMFIANGKSKESNYKRWAQMEDTIAPKFVVTESTVASTEETGNEVNVTLKGTTVYGGKEVILKDARGNTLATAIKVTNPNNGKVEYLTSEYTEYDKVGNKVGVYTLNPEGQNGRNTDGPGNLKYTKVTFTPELGYVGTANGVAIRAWDENRNSTGWEATATTIKQSEQDNLLADKDKISENVNKKINNRLSMDTVYIPKVIDIKPVGKDETTIDEQGKKQSASPKIPDHGTVESINNEHIDEAKVSKDHVLINKKAEIKFSHVKEIPGKTYKEDTKVTEETVLTYEDGGTETFKPVDKVPANTEIAVSSNFTVTGSGNVTASNVRIVRGTFKSNEVPAGSVLEGAEPTVASQVTVLRNGAEVTLQAGEKVKKGDQLVTPLQIVDGNQHTIWKVTFQKGDIIPKANGGYRARLVDETSVDQLIEAKGDSVTLNGKEYVNNNDVIPKGTKTAGTTIDLVTLTLPKATHVNPQTGEVTTVERRYSKVTDTEIVIENEGTYTLVPKTTTNEKGETVYEDATVVFTPHPNFVGVGTGVTLRQPDIDYDNPDKNDSVRRRYGVDYGSAKYTPTVTPHLTATITRKIHYVYEGDTSTAAKDKAPILTIDGKPVTNEQTLTYNRDYVVMSEDGQTEKDITVATEMTLERPITVDRYVRKSTGEVVKEPTQVTVLKPGDVVKAGTKLPAGTVIVGAWKSINPGNDYFTNIISPTLKGYTAEVQLPENEYTKSEKDGVQSHVRSSNQTPVGVYTPTIKDGKVNTQDIGSYEPMVSAVRADDKDDFDVYVYYKADKQVARVVYIDMDAANNADQGVLETHTGSKLEAEKSTTDTITKDETLTGDSATRIKYSTAATIAKYEAMGYELKRDGFTNDEDGNRIVGGRKFDEESVEDSANAGEKPQNQTFYVFLGHKRDTGAKTETADVTRTINYKYKDGGAKAAESVTETLNFKRNISIDMALAAAAFPEDTATFNAENTKATPEEKKAAQDKYDEVVAKYNAAAEKAKEDPTTSEALRNADKNVAVTEKTLADAKKANNSLVITSESTQAQKDAKAATEAALQAAQEAYNNALTARDTARTNYLAADSSALAKAVITTQQALEAENAKVAAAKAEYEAKVKDNNASDADKEAALTKFTDALAVAKTAAANATAAKTAFTEAKDEEETLNDAKTAEAVKNKAVQDRDNTTKAAKDAARQAYYDAIIAKVKEETKKETPDKNKVAAVSFGEWKALGSSAMNLPANEQLSDAEKQSDNAFNHVTSPTIAGYLADKVAIDKTDAIDPLADDYSVDVFYEKGEQRATVKFVEVDANNPDTVITPGVAEDLVEIGKTGDNFATLNTAAVKAAIKKLQDKGYTLVSDGFENPGTGVSNTTFDNDPKKDQEFVVKVKATVVEIPSFDPTKPVSNDNPKPTPGVTPIDPSNPSGPKWTEDLIKAVKVQEEVTRTIKYVYEDGTEVPAEKLTDVADKKVKTLKFTRPGKINVVTGEITYGDWSENQTFEAVKSPTIENYTAAVAGVTPTTPDVPAKTGVTATDKDFEEVVVYKKAKPVTITPTDEVPNDDPNTPVDPNNPIQPGKPIDPSNPDGPKWTKDLIDKLRDARKEEVTRTITYKYSDKATDLKDADAAKVGADVKENVTVTNTVTFKRPVTIDPITKEFTYGDWVADNNDTTLEGKTDLPKVDGYIATGDVDASKKDVTDVKATDKDITDKVVYKALGKYVPVVPEGFNPPTIEHPQYPNSDDPSKPGDPTTTTKIPYVPGLTPLNPTTGQPLEPVTPGNPKDGYKVPELPVDPTQNTTITYVKDGSQVAVVHFVDETGKAVNESVIETGDTGGTISTTKADAVKAALVTKGYEVIDPTDATVYTADKEGFYKEADRTFDAVSDKATGAADEKVPSQQYYVIVKAKELPVVPTKPVNKNNEPVDPTDPTTPNKPRDPETTVTPKPTDPVPNDPKGRTYGELGLVEQVTRTIDYVYDNGTKVEEDKLGTAKDERTKTLTFTRNAKINAVTGEVTYLDANGNATTKELAPWTPATTDTFNTVNSPVIDTYVLLDSNQKTITGETVVATDNDITHKVVYKKAGSIKPQIPAGVTPLTPATDTPYPNNPQDPSGVLKPDPTKPTDPTQPNGPTTPVIPEVPGYTPYGPNGKPLEKDPNGGYKVPDLPTDPTQDTSIVYVKNGSQLAVTKFVDVNGNGLAASVVDSGDEGTNFTKDADVTATINAILARGYEKVANVNATEKEYPTEAADKVFDKDASTDQEFTVTFKAKELPVDPTKPVDPNNKPVDPTNPTPENPTTPRDPETPVTPKPEDKVPNDPKGRTYGELGLVETVTRTINYVKNDGSKAADSVKETLTFTRNAKINAVTGEVTYLDASGNATTKEAAPWTATNGTEFKPVTSPTGTEKPELANYTPTKAVVEAKTGVNATDEGIVETVVYNPSTTNVDPNPVNPGENPDPNKVVENDPKKRTLKELGLIEEVTHTVHYKLEDGSDAGIADNVQTVTFTRTAKIDAVTGAILEYGNWTPDTKAFAAVDTPAKDGYIASAKTSTANANVGATDKDTEETIIYRKLGSYVPVVPAGVTPPADFDKTPKPYPNATPEDPTRPGTPTTPTTTIPEIPGTTPVGPDGTPLTKNPNGGYDLPPVPTDPTQNTTITYVKDGSQVAVTHFIEVNSATDKTEKGAVAQSIVDTGDTGKAFTKGQSVTDTINALKAKGYTVVENGYPENGTFDADATTNQEYKVLVTVKPVTITPNTDVPNDDPNTPVDPNNPIQPNKPIDPNNPEGPKWTKDLIDKLRAAREETVTRTITYKYSTETSELKAEDAAKAGQTAADTVTNTVTFKRPVTIDPVTKEFTYGDWVADNNDTTLEGKADLPVVAGYVATGDVEASKKDVTDVKATDKDITQNVVYKTVGKYVPVIPSGITPPASTNVDPKPYNNDPQDGSKVKDPDPTNPVVPGTTTPIVPQIPGTTPVGPDGKPLKPVDPADPSKGYVPPTPTDPTKDTSIIYVKDGSQVAVVHFVDEKGNSVNESVVETGDTGNTISTTKADAVKAALEAKGYEVVAPTDALYTADKEGFYKEADRKFDAVSDKATGVAGEKVPSQQYYVIVKGKELPVDPTKPVDPNNNPVDPTNPTPTNPTTPRDPETPVTPKPEDKVPNDPKGRTYGELGLVEQVTRTINYVKNDGSKAAEPVKETLTFTRKAKINAVTGEVTYLDNDGNATTKEEAPWTPANGDKFTEKVSPAVPNYTPTVEKVAEKTGVTATDEDIVETVVYNPTKQTVDPNAPKDPSTPDVTPKPNDVVPNDPKGRTYKELGLIEEVTRTVHYVYEDGTKAAEDKVQTITFTRTAEIDTVTGAISNFGTWTLKDENNTFESETTEAKDGYIASAAKSTEVTGVQATDKDTEETIIYRKLGSYVPVVPAGVTPPANFDKTPKPYPNATPEDPTRPGTPTTPTTTIPEIPGTTPVGPDGTPLTKNPNGGYDLPPVPTDPTQNTTITYVKDGSQVAVVHFVDEKGNSVNESVVETGDTGNTISTTKADAVKAALEAKGYEVVAPTDALYTTDKEGFYKEATRTFDAVSDKSTGAAGEKVPSQQYYVIVKGKDLPVDPTKPLDPNNNPVDPTNPTPENPTKPRDPETPVTPKPEDKVPNDPKGRTYGELGLVEQVTRTINYVKNDGSKAAEPVKETLTFTRKAKINAVTGEVTYLDNDGNATTKEAAPWTPVNNDTTFDKVISPSVPDYTPTKAEVPAKENVKATDEDIVETVVYNPTKVTVTPNDPNVDPEKPLNPNDPNGLKYKDLKLTEEVKRTITYTYADDVADTSKRGTDAAPKHETTVSFTRTATVNQATGEVTYGDWTAVNNDTTLEGKTELPVIPGYVATGDVESVKKDVANVSATDKDIVEKVVYKDLGKYVPVVPEGTTPPSITDPKYPNNPTDPTKPGEPTTTIPNVPGLTPLDPSTGKPLEPKDPNDLTKGYKPPVPQDPTKDTNIVYVVDGSQVTVVHFVDEDGKAVHTSFVEAGDAGAKFTKAGEVTKVVEELKAAGYTVVPNKAGQAEYPGEAGVFDSVDDKGKDGVSQVYYVTVAKTVPVTPTNPENPNEDPKNPKPGDPIDPNKPDGPKWTEDALNKLNNIKSVTRTITYVKAGTDEEVSTTEAPKVTNKVSFTRTAIVNPKDGSVVGYDTNGDGKVDLPATDTTNGWTAAGTAKFAEVKSPVVKGYVVKPNQDTQGDLVEADGSKVKASATDLTVDSPNQDLKVRYVPVGTWTPKVPDGETPIDPIPYPNDPKDPGKVIDPNKPTDPNDPNKPSVPVVPHIPGTTPKDPNGNPLKPVDPEDPSKGYVPPTPTTPTENTVIEYVKDTQKAVTKFVDPSGNPIPGVNNIEEKGKSGEPLTKATEVTNEIAKLIAKGYELVSNNYGKDNNGNFDKDSGKDQEYTVVLTPHVEPIKPFDPTNPNDPNKPKPGTPIDPNNPDGPKWTEELIKSLETTKHVTRTISYVDKDGNKVEYTDKDGNKSTADVTDKVTFTREAKINLVTGAIEYGKWTPVNNDTTFDKVTSPVVPGYVLKDPAQKEVAETTGLTENSKDENIKVVYVPVGKLVPKVPDGVTPPTPTPYDNDPQDPGKVVPPSPTKPQDPQDPNSPKVPVIPHIPGTTPKVPQDPTKPVDPNTNPLVPLKPVDPKDPSKGYEVPPVPTNPGTDTPIVYENDKQKAITNFVDNNGKVVSDPVVDQGDSGSKFTKSGEVESKIQELVKKGYIVTSNDYPSADTDRVFDNDKDKDQIFNVKVTPLIVPTDPNSPDKPQVPTDPTKPVGPNNPLKPVTPSTPEPGKPVFPEDPNSPVWPDTVKDLVTESSATRTITYVDHNGKEVAATHTETIKFKRTAKVNLVTGEITYGEWTVEGNDTILNGNKLPKVDGYIARGGDIKESQEDIKAEAGKNITQTVVYAKLGSWIPRLPEGQTNVPPTPYTNDPTDPTKPGTDKPKVPYVPGFIPVDPNGNPLKPVDPNDPTKGYEVPDVPADPTQDTPIKYIPVPTPNNGGGNNGGGGGNIPTPQPQPQPNPAPAPAPQPEPSPAPNPVPVTPETPEQPVAPVTPEQPAEPATPQYMDGQRELPNTGTEAHSSLAALGLLGALSGFGLIARKKRKDEE